MNIKIKVLFISLFCIFVFGFGTNIILYMELSQNIKNKSDYNSDLDGQDVSSIFSDWSKSNTELDILEIRNFEDLMIKSIQKISPSVVNITISKNIRYIDPFEFFWNDGGVIEQKKQIGWWSAILISQDWLLMTNKHVVSDPNAEYTVVLNDGTIYNTSSVWLDPNIDIAILQMVDENWKKPQNLKPAKFIDFKQNIKIWQFAIAVGNALAEYQNSVTMWIISAKNRKLGQIYQSDSLYIWLYQTDTSINPWNSGWPLVDLDWNVIWINTAISSAWNWIGFALPVNQEFVNSTIQSIKKYNKISRPFIGIWYEDLNKQMAKEMNIDKITQWTIIKQIVSDSMAMKAWLQVWDILIEVDGQKINTELPFMYHIYRFNVWDRIKFKVFRNSEFFDLEIELWNR